MSNLGLQIVPIQEVDEVVADARARGCRVFRIPAGARDAATFFAAVRDALPLNPPLGGVNWDALADSLCEGLRDLDEECIAIVWPDSALMRSSSRVAYDFACSVFEEIVSNLADESMSDNSPKQLLVLLAEAAEEPPGAEGPDRMLRPV